jgi:hypothetical protein
VGWIFGLFCATNSTHCGHSPPKGRFDHDEQVSLKFSDCSYIKATLGREVSQDPNPLLDQTKFCVFLSVTAVSYGVLSRVE